ncbi:MAG TPA: hypothetical protein PKE64_13310 [Anaerolineae bacterium]|nr:hypothetical protein [Anaerolineae bacterium]
MQRVNLTLDGETEKLLGQLAQQHYDGNKSLTVRAAIQSLAQHLAQSGWVVGGYTPVSLREMSRCGLCGGSHDAGRILYRPVFERGQGRRALTQLPTENRLYCAACAELEIAATSP